MYQDLSARHDWPVKKANIDLPMKMKGNSKHTFGYSLNLFGVQNFTRISGRCLAHVTNHLQRRLNQEQGEASLLGSAKSMYSVTSQGK